MVSDVMMTSSDDGDRIINIISKSLCFKCNSNSETTFTEEQQQIYLGDHLTRSWTRDERASSKPVASPTTSEPGNRIVSTNSAYQIKQGQIARPRSSIRESRGSRRNWATKAAIQSVTPEELHDWKESFDNLLKSPLGSKLFRIFLESEIAEENLLFWEACEELKQMKKEKRMQKLIQNIFDDYISVYSPREINIDYKMREDIVEQLNSSATPDPNVFREAQMQIYHLMHRDSYPRFIASAQAIQDRMDERKRGSKREHREPEVKKKGGSLVLCCYRNDDVEMRHQAEEMKVEESPPINGKTRSNVETLEQQQHTNKKAVDERQCDSASSGERADTVTSLKDTVKVHSPQQQEHLVEVTPPGVVDNPRKLSDGATDCSSKRESGIELISFGSTHCDDTDAVIEKNYDVINVTTAPVASDLTHKKISSVEVPVQVIKGPDDSGVIVHEDDAEVKGEKSDVTVVADDVK